MTAIRQDEENFVRLDMLLRDKATRAVRVQFDKHFLPPLTSNYNIHVLSNTPEKIRKRNYSFINTRQWKLIDSAASGSADSTDFDITLMMCLFRQFQSIVSGGTVLLGGPIIPGDTSIGADLARIQHHRNHLAHLPGPSVSDNELTLIWIEACEAIERLGGKSFVQECNDLRSKILDPSYVVCLKDSMEERLQLQETFDSLDDDVEQLKEYTYLNQHPKQLPAQFEDSALYNLESASMEIAKDYQYEVLCYWKQKLEHFTPTHVSAEILTAIMENQCLVVIGSAASGKSSNSFYAGFRYVKENGINLLAVQNPKYIRYFQRPELGRRDKYRLYLASKLPVSHNSHNVKTLCLFDDFVGRYHLSQYKLLCWKERIDNLMDNKELKIVLTCRSTIYETQQVQVLLDNLKDVKCIHLDKELVVSSEEKLRIMDSYNKDVDISKINESVVNCTEFVPIICELASIFPHTKEVFLERSREIILQDLKSMQENNKLSFLALSLLVLRNNKILKRELRKDILDLDESLDSLCRELNITPIPSKRCVLSHLQGTLCHFYVSVFRPNKQLESFSYFAFRNTRLFEIVSHIIVEEFGKTLIMFGKLALLRDQILFTNENAQESTIVLTSVLKHLFFRRLVAEINNNNTWDVVDAIQMQCPVFLDEFISFLKSDACDLLKIENFFETKDTGQTSCWMQYEYQSAAFIFTAIGSIPFVKYILEIAQRNTFLSKIYNLKNNANFKSLLHLAYEKRQFDVLKILLNNILSLETDVLIQYDFLCSVCKNRDESIIRLFLSALPFPNINNLGINFFPLDKTPLGFASQFGNVNIAKLLLDSGEAVNEVCCPEGSSALSLSCENNHIDVVSLLIHYKADVNGKVSRNDKDNNQLTMNPLYVSCKNGNKVIVQILLENKCDVNVGVVYKGEEINILCFACFQNQIDIVRLFLKHGSDVNSTVRLRDGLRSPLCISLLKKHYDLANLLIEHGANLDFIDTCNENKTLLMITINEHITDGARLLLNTNNVNVNKCDSKRNIALHHACEVGDDNIVEMLLHKETQINVENVDWWTPLHFACKSGNGRSVSLLLKQDIVEIINRQDMMGRSPLHLACMGNNTDILDLLLNKNFVLVMQRDTESEFTPFHYAIQYGDLQTVKLLLKHGVLDLFNPKERIELMNYCSSGSKIDAIIQYDPSFLNQRNQEYETVLHIACRYLDRDKQIFKKLLTYNLDLNAVDSDGKSALHIASVECDLELVELLVCKGANTNIQDRNGSTPLHDICRYLGNSSDFDKRIKYFVSHGALVNQTDQYGDTPLHISLSRGKTEIAKTLLSCNASVNCLNNARTSPLHITCLTIVDLLIQKDASINVQDINGYTPLHNACDFDETGIVEILLKYHSDVNIQTIDGLTPLHKACKRGNYTIVTEILRYKNPDLAIIDKNGRTSLDYTSVHDADLALLDKNGRTTLDQHLRYNHKRIKQLLMLRLNKK